ncbi:MAG: PLP-dependent aminotransferase family protein [Candidatus Dormibacteria bacterium]
MRSPAPVDQAVGPLTMTSLLGAWRADGPAYQQLAQGIRRLVADGRLPMQSRLPAERHLALQLGVSRNTVTAAYERLREEGYLDSRQGSGTWTTVPDRPAVRGDTGAIDIDLTVAAPAAPPGLQGHINAAVADIGRYLGQHGYEPLGLPVLRSAVAGHLSARGLPTRDTQVLITNGAGQALDLVVRALLRRGGTALVELPTYPSALDTFRAADVRMVQVPVSGKGWDLAIMRSTLKRTRPGLAYLVPDFQNPTGALVSDEQRQEMLVAAMSADCHVVADQTFIDLRLDAGPVPRMAAQIADDPRVLTIGSMSKAFWGGLRIGWIRATPTLVQRLARVRATQDMASPVLEQLVAARLLASPERILATQRRRAVHQRDALAAALQHHLPGWRWTLPRGGLSLWVELPEPNSESLAFQALSAGVRLAPGPRFGVPGTMDRFVRIPFSLPAPILEDAAARLAVAAAASLSTNASRRGPAFVA